MKRIRIVALCLVASFAMGAVVTSSASATAPEFGRCLKKAKAEGTGFSDSACKKPGSGTLAKFEWVAGPGAKNKFTSKMKEATTATLESVGKPPLKVTCTEQTATGEIANAKEIANLKPKFNNCSSSGFKCASAGAGEGEILTAPLGGIVGVEKLGLKEGNPEPLLNKLAVELHSETGPTIVSFECSGLAITTKGSLLHPITANKMQLVGTEKFTAAKGEQKPDKFVGGPVDEHTLETSTNGGAFEEAGQTITSIQTNEEAIEASTVN